MILGTSVPPEFVAKYFYDPDSQFYGSRPKRLVQLNHKFSSYDEENKELVKLGSNFLRFNNGLEIPDTKIEEAFVRKVIPCRFELVPPS